MHFLLPPYVQLAHQLFKVTSQLALWSTTKIFGEEAAIQPGEMLSSAVSKLPLIHKLNIDVFR